MRFFLNFILIYFLLSAGALVIKGETAIGQNSENYTKHRIYHAIIQYKKGDYEKSEQILTDLKKNLIHSDTLNLISINNLLGIINKNFGNNKDAINYYFENIKLISKKNQLNTKMLSKTYNNIGNIFKNNGQYSKAIKYYNEAINILIKNDLSVKEKAIESEYIYYNLAIVYYNIKEYGKAVLNYKKSLEIKQRFHLKGIEKIYFNLARTYEQLNNFKKADSLYNAAINIRRKLHGENYYRLAPFYVSYGNFLLKQNKYKQAKNYLQKAKILYEDNYGLRHPYTANSYTYLGKYYSAVSNPDSALYWYQKSLIAVTKRFNSYDVRINPSDKDCFSHLQLLKGLKLKAGALLQKANNNQSKAFYSLSIKTTNTALALIKKIRDDYISADNKLIITQIEKECYSTGLSAAVQLYNITGNIKFGEKAYQYAFLSKASVLNTVSEEDKELNTNISDTERIQKTALENKIASYNKLIFEENENRKPDSVKIQFLQSKLFNSENSYDSLFIMLKNKYQINRKSHKILSVKEIQGKLPKNTSLLEYFIPKNSIAEEHVLYTFIINRDYFQFYKTRLSRNFYKNMKAFKTKMNKREQNSSADSFNQFNRISYNLYLDLFRKADSIIKDKNIIIVPDEEIAYLSFDALLKSYKDYENINYSDLDYLIYKHCFSYAYSTPLLIRNKKKKYSDFVYAFAPSYNDTISNVLRQKIGNLAQTQNEIHAALNVLKGKAYIGSAALEDSFKIISDKGGIIHFAGHASYEDKQREFSFLAFSDKIKTSKDDGLLFAYEIEKMTVNSPMVVLSACNTGRGRLYSGEGVYSLSRSFLKAGAESVIYNLWNVNDDSGYRIMTDFYKNLSNGEGKNTALHHAKLNYLNTASPMLSDPVYWSGYVLTGSTEPLTNSHFYLFILIGGCLFLFIAIILFAKKYLTNKQL